MRSSFLPLWVVPRQEQIHLEADRNYDVLSGQLMKVEGEWLPSSCRDMEEVPAFFVISRSALVVLPVSGLLGDI